MKIVILILLTVIVACNPSSNWENNEVKELETVDEVEVVAVAQEVVNYAEKVNQYHDSMSVVFYSGSNNVLPEEAISPSGSLNYYEPNEAYSVEAKFTKIENGEVIKMKTSTDRLPEYRTYGTLSFDVEGNPLELMLYQNVEQPEYMFCPFKDLTNGNETYGAGRYLDFKLDDLVSPTVDFNYCYNPYCAYNPDYSCPIPPFENHLDVAILAGEKKWH